MAKNLLVNSYKSVAANTIEKIYESPAEGDGTVITSFTASNNTTSSKTFKVYISSSTSAPVAADAQGPLKIVKKNKFDPGHFIVGHTIPAGGSVWFESNAIGGIGVTMTGDEK
jgi:hypothetical protein